MMLTIKQDGRSHAPQSRTLQEVAEEGVPGGGDDHPQKYREMEEAGGPDTTHVESQIYNKGAGLDDSIPNPKGKHQHPGGRLDI